MKTITGKYYQCEFCGRKMFGAGAMGYHVKYCRENPNNKHRCYGFFKDECWGLCQHLERTEILVPSGYYEDDYGGGSVVQTQFTCKKTGKKMYSYKREKQYWQYVTPDMIRMPLECELYSREYNEAKDIL